MTSSDGDSGSTASFVRSTLSGDCNQIIAPSAGISRPTLARSSLYWNSLAEKAHFTRLRRDSIQLTNLLQRVPALPEDLHQVESVCGHCSWKQASPGCNSPLPDRQGQERHWWLDLPSSKPTFCSLAYQNSYFSFEESKLNGVSFLFLGWAYILSVNMLERQRVGFDYVYYSRKWADQLAFPTKGKDFIEIYIGEATAEEWRWWSAVVMLGRGWLPRNHHTRLRRRGLLPAWERRESV
jgi:hypothetical protein